MAETDQETGVQCTATPTYLCVKRCIDGFVAALALVVTSPLIGLIALLIRLGGRGPVFFRQTRAGWHGRPFTLLKFRTMQMGVDPFGCSPQSGTDPRLTRIGRLIREWSLDELPQLVNVLRGEMSLVGPRPLYIQQIQEWNARQRGRMLVKPGLTGLAQIHGRGGLTIEEKLEWDVRYVERAGFVTDLGIIFRTFARVFRRGDIYEVRYSQERERRSDSSESLPK